MPVSSLVASALRQERQDPSSSSCDAAAGTAQVRPLPRALIASPIWQVHVRVAQLAEAPAGTPESSSHAPKILLQPHTPHLPVADNAWWVPGSTPGSGSKNSYRSTTQWQSAPSLNLICSDQWWCFTADHTSCSAMWKRNRLVNGLLPVQIRPRDFEGPGHQDRVAGAASYPPKRKPRWTFVQNVATRKAHTKSAATPTSKSVCRSAVGVYVRNQAASATARGVSAPNYSKPYSWPELARDQSRLCVDNTRCYCVHAISGSRLPALSRRKTHEQGQPATPPTVPTQPHRTLVATSRMSDG